MGENLIAALSLSEDAIKHLQDLPSTVSQIDLSESRNQVFYVYLSGDILYTAIDKILYVYSMNVQISPIASYQLADYCYSGIITDNHLYLGGKDKLHEF